MALARKLSSDEIRNFVNAIKSPRARELERLQAYYDGTQYVGRVAYTNLASNVPRFERAPCIKYPLAKAAIESNVALCMGGQRFPRVLSMSSENDDLFAGAFGLSQDESETLDAFNGKLCDLCGLETAFAQAYRVAQAARSAALVLCYRDGRPAIDVLWPAYCTPTYTGTQVVSLEIRYRYLDQMLSPDGAEWWPVVKEYRRVIDAKADTVFKPKEIWDVTDIKPTSAVDTAVPHGFGFCPVWWYARQKPSFSAGSVDGVAVADGKLDELDAINHALSSRHLAAMYAGDPMLVGIGVDIDEMVGGVGRSARPDPGLTNLYGFDAQPRESNVLRKGPGEFWRAERDTAKIEYLTLPADALDAIDKHAQDLCSKVREALRYVWIDPEQLTGSGDVSGKTLAFVFSSQLHAVSQDRSDFGRNCLLPVLGMIYRALVARSQGVYLPGLAKVLPIIKRFLVTTEDKQTIFLAPQLYLKWGDFFEPSDVDEATRVTTATQAAEAGIITKATAVEHVRDVFAIGNVDQYVDALEAEALEKQQAALQQAQAMAAIKGPPQPGGDGGGAPPPAAAAKAAAPPAPKRGAQQKKKAGK